MRRLFLVLLLVAALIAVLLLAGDRSFWSRYFSMPDNPVAEIDWFEPLVVVGEEPVSGMPAADTADWSFTEKSLQSVSEYAKSMDSYAVLVVRDGKRELEYYAEGFGSDRMTDSQSMHKPLVPLMVGAAIADGYIESVDEPVRRYLDEWQDDPRGDITIRDLLYMESGLAQPPVSASPFSAGTRAFLTSRLDDAVLSLELANEPGTAFDFHFLSTQLLSLIIERAAGQPYADYFRERLWQRIGAGPARLRLDRPDGNPQTFCCIQATARGWARVGELILNRGRIGDDQVLPAEWIERMLSPSRVKNFGMHVWVLDRFTRERVVSETGPRKAVPLPGRFSTDVIFFEGRGGQRVYILPLLKTVVVRTGAIRMEWNDVRFINQVVAGFTKEPLLKVPDYSAPESWHTLPDRKDKADLTPPGAVDNQSSAATDAFFIHPTTFYDKKLWNASAYDTRIDVTTDGVLAGQASIFNGCCAVYTPRYRQAALRAVADKTGAGTRAYDLAYDDVRAAFAELAGRSDRPFIIAGHSQGALHALRLAQEVAATEEWKDRLVAAYVVGIGVSLARYRTDLDSLRPCDAADDTGCVVSWNTFSPVAKVENWSERVRDMFAADIAATGVEAIQCNNPLDWPGAVQPVSVAPFTDGSGLFKPQPLSGAECKDGALVLTRDPGLAFKDLRMPGGIWHLADYALFYQAVRVNAAARAAAFKQGR